VLKIKGHSKRPIGRQTVRRQRMAWTMGESTAGSPRTGLFTVIPFDIGTTVALNDLKRNSTVGLANTATVPAWLVATRASL
jgi:hypothetical protein